MFCIHLMATIHWTSLCTTIKRRICSALKSKKFQFQFIASFNKRHWLNFFLNTSIIECSQMLYSKKRQQKMINTCKYRKFANTTKEHDARCDFIPIQTQSWVVLLSTQWRHFHTRLLFLSFSSCSAIHCVSAPHEIKGKSTTPVSETHT